MSDTKLHNTTYKISNKNLENLQRLAGMTMSEIKAEILQILAEKNLSVQFLADRLHMHHYKVYYLLHHETARFDINLYCRIMSILEKID